MSTLQKNVLKMPSKPEVSWAHSGNTLLILRLFISYFPFRDIGSPQIFRAQIWFLDSLKYCFHWLFRAYLAVIRKGFDACRNIAHLEDISNGTSGVCRGVGDDTFGEVAPIAAAKSAHWGPTYQCHLYRDLALVQSLQAVPCTHTPPPKGRNQELVILGSTSWGDYREHLGKYWVS